MGPLFPERAPNQRFQRTVHSLRSSPAAEAVRSAYKNSAGVKTLARTCANCGERVDNDLLVACPSCRSPFGNRDELNLSPAQLRQLVGQIRREIFKQTIAIFSVVILVTGGSLWGIKNRLEHLMIERIAAQFEEPRISATLRDIATGRAEEILTQQIEPAVEEFNARTAGLLEEVAAGRSHIQAPMDRIVGLESNLAKVERGLVEIQFLTYAGHNIFLNPYHERIMTRLNDLAAVAVPDPIERRRFIQELQGYAAETRGR